MAYQLEKIISGIRRQCEPLGKSEYIEALKAFAHDEVMDSKSHKWNSNWRCINGEWVRSWLSYSGRHGGSYRIREVE